MTGSSTTLERDPAWITESASISPGRESDLLAIDSRPCELCGLTIDRHDQIDDGDGPIHFCPDLFPDEMTLPELERRAELRFQEEVAAMVARLEAADDPSKRPPPAPRAEAYRTPQSTEHAFWCVVRSDDAARLKAWFAGHQQDVPFLLKLYEARNARA